MRFRLIMAMAAAWMAMTGSSNAQSSPVVVELFTSQGCSSCPPADAFLAQYANRSDVIALAMHIDYWDYIGWKDTFASPEFTQRQYKYARAGSRRVVYTPQMIVNGHNSIEGVRRSEFDKQVGEAAQRPPVLDLRISRNGDTLTINAERLERGLGDLDVQVIRYKPSAMVEIRRGENAGRSIEYSNIVESISRAKNWNNERALSVDTNAQGENPIVVLIQQKNHGRILAAARLF